MTTLKDKNSAVSDNVDLGSLGSISQDTHSGAVQDTEPGYNLHAANVDF